MKVAVSSTGQSLQSTVDPRFGRAEYLVIVETDTLSVVEVINNQSAKDAAHGAGINAASRIAEAGAQALLTGRVGPKAAAVCEKAGIAMIEGMSGTVEEAVQNYKQQGSVPQTQSAPAPGQGAGMGQGMGQGMGRGLGMGGGRCGGGGGGRGGGGGGRGGGGCRRQGFSN